MPYRSCLVASGVVASCLLFCLPSRADAYGSPIDSIDLSTIFGYADTFSPTGTGLLVIGDPERYHLHDGRTWEEGAGSLGETFTKKTSVNVTGNQIDYILDLPIGSRVFFRIDYDGGNDSSYGELVSTSQLALHAITGSKTATLSGYAKISVNEPANYNDNRYHYFNAPIGADVPFSLVYTLASGTWQATTMDNSFTYNMNGTLDFTHAIVPEPTGVGAALAILAIAQARRCRGRRTRA